MCLVVGSLQAEVSLEWRIMKEHYSLISQMTFKYIPSLNTVISILAVNFAFACLPKCVVDKLKADTIYTLSIWGESRLKLVDSILTWTKLIWLNTYLLIVVFEKLTISEGLIQDILHLSAVQFILFSMKEWMDIKFTCWDPCPNTPLDGSIFYIT